MEARTVIETILPSPVERRIVLDQLLASSRLANSIAPNSWGVTLKPGGFRLNVGQVEVLTFGNDTLRVLVVAPSTELDLDGGVLRDIDYEPIKLPHRVFEGSAREFDRAKQTLLPIHAEFVREAATTLTGMPRQGSPHKRYHSADLMNYAEKQPTTHPRYFLLLWNPTSGRTEPGLMESLFAGERTESIWTCGSRTTILSGDYVFLRRTVERKGLIGFGCVLAPVFDGSGPRIRVKWKYISENEFIRDGDPEFINIPGLWSSQSGGTLIDEDDAARIIEAINLSVSPMRLDVARTYREGQSSSVLQTTHEKSPAAREACLRHYKYKFDCEICGFNFINTYGPELGSEYIHVHHINPRSHGERETNPATDLIPVCPNCHAMLHQNDPPLRPEDLKILLRREG